MIAVGPSGESGFENIGMDGVIDHIDFIPYKVGPKAGKSTISIRGYVPRLERTLRERWFWPENVRLAKNEAIKRYYDAVKNR